MPLMMLNLRALPDGLESHKEFLKEEVDSWLRGRGKLEEADVTFICSSVDSDNEETVRLSGHQAVLAPVSEVLREMFELASCSHNRSMVHITMDCDPQVLQSILCLIYKGKTYLSTSAVEKMKTVVKMLGLKFPGGFDRQILAKNSSPASSQTFRATEPRSPLTPQAPPAPPSPPAPPANRSQSRSPARSARKRSRTDSAETAKSSGKKCRASPSQVSATERMNLHVSMTLELKDCPPGTTVPCKMPSCGAQVSYDQLSSHFLAHETSARGDNSPVCFPCVACGVNFKLRRELDSHTKLKHAGMSSIKDRLDLLSDSSDEEDTFNQVSETVSEARDSVKCSRCDSVLPSALHLRAHSCSPARVIEEPVKCSTCFRTFRTNKAHQVHLRDSHKGKTSSTSGLMSDLGTEKETPSAKKYGCQICTKRFSEMRELRTHYTLYHFWDDLTRDFGNCKDLCKICQKKYPTEDHLIQHMGNFHCMIDKYLVKKGLRVVSKEKTARLLSWRCEICKVNQASSAALKSHLSVKHYSKQLLAEFPVGRGKLKKCPKCFKLFDQSSVSTVLAHVGSFHDEVIKYAAHHLDLEAVDVENIPVDDFDDGTVGILVQSEEGISKPLSPSKKKGVFDYLQCQICLQDLPSSHSLKIHYILHFEKDFKNKYFSTKCPHCDKTSADIFMNQKHVATDHTDLSLLPFMEARGLWVNKSVVLDLREGSVRMKRNDVLIKKMDKRLIQNKLQELEQYKHDKLQSYKCDIVGCEKSCETEDQLLIHLTIEHFWSELCQEFGDSYSVSAKRCIMCSAEMDPTLEKTGYFKHLAVDHKVVLKYAEKAREQARPGGSKIKLSKLTNRMEPPPPSLQAFNGVAEGLKNEEKKAKEQTDQTEGGSQASVVIKTEAQQGPSTTATTSGINQDIMSKIRNIFSDDSGSDSD